MAPLRVGVVGASGTSGAVAARLVASHPRAALVFATSDARAGESVAAALGMRLTSDVRFVPNAAARDHARACDAVLLATPADVSMRLVPAFVDAGKQVVDLSGAFRLDANEYPRWYAMDHAAPALLSRAHYGLPEVFGSPPSGTFVANPGCYPTAALLALAPLVREGLVEPAGIVVDAKSGVTGAGRQSGEAYSFLAVDGDVRAYKVLAHQHTPEIGRALSRIVSGDEPARRGESARVTFTAHLLPVPRGLLATCYARPRAGATRDRVHACLADAYARSAFVRVVPPGDVRLSGAVGTNLALVGATADDDVIVALGAIDNLLKGAAGQALQNLNLLNGWDEALGLEHLQRHAA
jgi:N-acetyl-gamma-glutamyl-phosphate reductase